MIYLLELLCYFEADDILLLSSLLLFLMKLYYLSYVYVIFYMVDGLLSCLDLLIACHESCFIQTYENSDCGALFRNCSNMSCSCIVEINWNYLTVTVIKVIPI